MFYVWTAIVCFWVSQPIYLASAKVVPQDRPVVFPEEHIVPDQIPERLLIEMSKIQNVTQLYDFFGPIDPGIGDTTATSSVDKKKLNGGLGLSRGANCEPELQTVEVEKPAHHTHVYWPMCVRTRRCGGCCTSALLTCTPVETSKIEAKVLHARYLGQEAGGQFEVMGMKVLTVEKHEKCTCKCKEQPGDCTELQEYKEEECRCLCTNKEDMTKCTETNWMWDIKTCSCKCRQIQECSTGFFYNSQNCRCESGRDSRIGRRKFTRDDFNISLELDFKVAPSDTESSNITETTTTSIPSTSTTEATTITETTTIITARASKRKRGRMARPGARLASLKVNETVRTFFDPTGDEVPFTLDNSKDVEKTVKIAQTDSATVTKNGTTFRK